MKKGHKGCKVVVDGLWNQLLQPVREHLFQKSSKHRSVNQSHVINGNTRKIRVDKVEYSKKDLEVIESSSLVIQKYFRRNGAVSVLRNLRNRRKKRFLNITELIRTERDLLGDYEDLQDFLITPFLDEPKKYIGKKKSKQLLQSEFDLFFNTGIQKIIEFHRMLLPKLESVIFKKYEKDHPDYVEGEERRIDFFCKIGKFFLEEMIPQIHDVYCKYIQNFDDITNTWRKIESSNKRLKIRQTIYQLLKKHQHGCKYQHELGWFFPLPISRLPRYRCLLGCIHRWTEKEHPDFQDLENARDSFGDMIRYMDTYHKRNTDIEELKNIKKEFTNPKKLEEDFLTRSNTPFVHGERRIGKRNMEIHVLKALHPKRLFFFNDCLMVSQIVSSRKRKMKKKKYEYQYHIPYESVRIYLSEQFENCFMLVDHSATDPILGDIFSCTGESEFLSTAEDIYSILSVYRRIHRFPSLEQIGEMMRASVKDELERLKFFLKNHSDFGSDLIFHNGSLLRFKLKNSFSDFDICKVFLL